MIKPLLILSMTSLLLACGSSNEKADRLSPRSNEPVDSRAMDTSALAGLGCSWQVASQADFANIAFPDDAARYWVALVPVTPGNRIRIDGRFPDARYFSFNSYDAALRPTDAIADIEVIPERGAQNPFSVSNVAAGALYSAYLAYGEVPESREPGTFYAGSVGLGPVNLPNSFLVPIIYRIYVSKTGEFFDGGVGLPLLTIESSNGEQSYTLPTCKEPILPSFGGALPDLGLNALLLGLDYPDELLPLPFPTAVYPPVTSVFYGLPDTAVNIVSNVVPAIRQLPLEQLPATGGGGFLSNIHNAYTTTAFDRSHGNLFLLRAKAPSWRGANQVGFNREQVRYWSICQNEFLTQRYTGCALDEKTPLDQEGYFTVAVSDAADRPQFATDDQGITWLPWGPFPDGLLLYRQMLPHVNFAEAIQNVPKGQDLADVMKDFAPQASYCRRDVFDQPGLTPRQRFERCQQDQMLNQ
jgi:hypothetical protein